MDERFIELKAVSKRHATEQQTVTALDGIDLNIRRNDYLAIVGASGSGKSTLLQILGCLDRMDSGLYLFKGKPVQELCTRGLAKFRNEQIGFVFQSFHLLPRLTALENVMLPLALAGISKDKRQDAAQVLLEELGLGDRLQHFPHQLSGGQKQRVAIARGLINDPDIILADEPTGNLDEQSTRDILDIFDRLHAKGRTIAIVTHEKDVAQRAQREIVIERGRIVSMSQE